jgi:hypothetical protein
MPAHINAHTIPYVNDREIRIDKHGKILPGHIQFVGNKENPARPASVANPAAANERILKMKLAILRCRILRRNNAVSYNIVQHLTLPFVKDNKSGTIKEISYAGVCVCM